MAHHTVLIVGGGTAGLSVAARLRRLEDPPEVTIIEPSDTHYYQPLWTLVGAGAATVEETARPEGEFIPDGAEWVRARVESFQPDQNQVTLDDGSTHTDDWVVVAAGIQLDWDKVEGLRENVGKHGVVSNYSVDTVRSTWEALKDMKSGKAIFTFPNTPIKCAGAPQKIMWLAEHHFERAGVRDKVDITFASAGAGIFGVPRYARTLSKLVEQRNIHTAFRHDLIGVDGPKKVATFRHLDRGDEVEMPFDVIHVTPPQSAPDFIKRSPLANADGWVEVDKFTTRHVRFPNVFSLGDASSLPNSKTAAAVRKQAPVLVANFDAARRGQEPHERYDGYASCPLVTGYGRLILAEFGYDGKIMETMPFDQSQERYSMYFAKAYALPRMYWHGMLRGRW